MREYTRDWVLSCLLYMGSCICMGLSLAKIVSSSLMLIVLIAVSLYAALFLFHACSSIDNIPIKKFWDRYPLLLLTYAAVLYVLEIHAALIALPFYIYEIILLLSALYTVIMKWRLPIVIRTVYAVLFLACILCQMYSSYMVLFSGLSWMILGLNAILLLLLNFGFAFLYQKFLLINQSIRNDYLYTLAENAVDIIFYYSLLPYPRFTFISPSVENIVGYKQDDFYKNPKLHLELTHEEDREIIRKAFSQDADAVNKNFIRWQRSDSEYIYLEFHNTPIFFGDKLIAIEGILRDITERKQVEQEMIDSKKSKQILLSYISHELKTPITYIVGYAEALQNNIFADDQERRNAVDLISSKAVFLQNLVEDLFQLSKMESNQFSFEFMQTKVFALFQFIVDKHKKEASNARIHYTSHIDITLKSDRYEVLVDIKRIQQVFANLLHNAIKHTPENGTISFECSIDERQENVVFKVIDSGSGIAPGDLPYIFKSFYQGKNSEKPATKGSGLGLSLSKQIMLSHKGDIQAQSKVGEGSTFTVTIPLYFEENHDTSGNTAH